MPNAETLLRLAQHQIEQHRDLSSKIDGLSKDFMADQLVSTASNIVQARTQDPSASFIDNNGTMQTCDKLSADILDFEAELREQYIRYWTYSETSAQSAKHKNIHKQRLAAIEALKKLCEYRPLPSSYLKLARSYLGAEDGANAQAAIQRGLSKFPDDLELLSFAQMNRFDAMPPNVMTHLSRDNPNAGMWFLAITPVPLVFGGLIAWGVMAYNGSPYTWLGPTAAITGVIFGLWFKFAADRKGWD